MLRQRIPTEVALKVSPDSVDMVGVVLSVVVFDEKCRSLNSVVMSEP